MKRIFAVVGFSMLGLLSLSSCNSTKTLSLLVWEGYADPSFVREFEEKCHCKVQAAYMGTSDELMAKLRGGSAANYDIISPSSDVATQIATSGMVAPLDLSKIPSYEQISPQLRNLPLVKVDGKVFGVPFTWGPDPMLYDTSVFPKAPESWAELWNPKFKGKISVWDDLCTIYLTAQLLGFDKPDPTRIYNLSDDQLAQVKKKLLELKPNIRKFWSTGGELTGLFQNHEVVAAMGWPLMTSQLKKAGFPIGEIIPKEGTTGWIDHMMITAGSKNKDLAYEFLEHISQAKAQRALAALTGYVPANPKAGELMTAEERKSLHLDEIDSYMARLNFWQNVARRDRYNEVWNEVKAAQ